MPEKPEILRKVDKKDKQILAILAKDSRKTLTKIAKEIKLSVDSVKTRIEKLKKLGIITGFTILRSYKLLGYPLKASFLIKLHNISQDKLNDFIYFLKRQPRVIILNAVVGTFDLEIVVIAKSSSDLENISRKIRTQFTDIIADWQTNIITESYKLEEFEL